MLKGGELDRCGVTLLAGKAVGAPFVGAATATLAVSEVLRLLHGGPVQQKTRRKLVIPLRQARHHRRVAGIDRSTRRCVAGRRR